MENLTQGANALATQNTTSSLPATINLPLLADPQEVILAARENTVEGERFAFDRIKMPSGGGITFVLQDENGKNNAVSELKVVIIGFKPYKSWYEKSYDQRDPNSEEIPLPDCFSADCQTGTGCTTDTITIPFGQSCATCPLGQWGSDRRGGKGKDCQDRMRLWFLLEGYAVPKYIDLPRGSLANFKDYRKRLTNKAKVYYGVTTVIGLEVDKNDKKVEFSKATFNAIGNLTPEERAAVKQYAMAIENSLKIERDSITEIHSEPDDEFNKVADNLQNDQAY